MGLLRSLKANMALICMGFGLLAATLVLASWLYGYWSNGLYGTKFEIDSCWQGLSACGVGLIGLFKWLVDSSKNSPEGEFPIAPRGGLNTILSPLDAMMPTTPAEEEHVKVVLENPEPVKKAEIVEEPKDLSTTDSLVDMAKDAALEKATQKVSMKMHDLLKKK